jgi:hypothetical protein
MKDTVIPTKHTDSEPEVQEIDPPVIARYDEQTVNSPDLAVLTQTSSDPNFISLTNSAAAIR